MVLGVFNVFIVMIFGDLEFDEVVSVDLSGQNTLQGQCDKYKLLDLKMKKREKNLCHNVSLCHNLPTGGKKLKFIPFHPSI